ncbi:MAG TPA: chorismate mutase [Aliidongia sp.]|uniref:chorismate mutase n=1 Tax=Aliidongia sp. TaxID=1914230 RepID=UPI002DDCB368|nr:chorismate mutase [Aliidongia sp.]HEV2677605.1 chorismate mutase [Aliidongia sp.]
MASETSLDSLRQKIDRIDEQMHDLLIERTSLVEEIRGRKNRSGAPVIQPAREAEIFRRLAARHRGPFPLGAVHRIWREIITAITALQQPLAIAVYAPDDQPGAWDIARDQYGSQVPMTPFSTISQVIRAVTDRSATIGVLPMPSEDEADPWWRQLISRDTGAPRIIGRLPFAGRGNARAGRDAVAIACQPVEPNTCDRSFIVVEVPAQISRARLQSCLAAAGFRCDLLAVWTSDGLCLALAELHGAVAPDDARLSDLSAQLGEPIDRVSHLGGYAEPFVTTPRA